MAGLTLLVALAHPDDEVGAAGAILAQRARGDRVVLLWLTRGEMTGAFGPVPREEVVRRRLEQGERAAGILGAEARFLDFPDTALEAGPQAAARVAGEIAAIRPDGVLTWGAGWTQGVRHPDHQACGEIVRAAITLARIERVVEPAEPHRAPVPVFTLRDRHSTLPPVAVDAEPHLDTVLRLAEFYRERIGFGEREWLMARLRRAGTRWGLRFAEEFDAWETAPGLVPALLPARIEEGAHHPDTRRPGAE